MKVFILLTVVAVAFATEQCGENQHFTSCGTDCPLTCDNYNNPPKFCNLMCRIGCECDKGYVQTSDGRCVRPEQCPARTEQCGENQHYTSCGTDCPLTCDNYDNPPIVCNFMCRIGCECDKGYVQTSDGRCVRPEQCPARTEQCGPNQHYTTCGTTCPLTCDNYANPPKFCNLMCKIGCECDEGFVETNDGKCIRSFQCPLNDSARPLETTCNDKPDPGMCMGYFPKFYYDSDSDTCKEFIYGGCQGNGNRYATLEECLTNCQGVKAKQSSPAACDLPAETGVCRGFFPRFYYDVQSGKCRKFIYGGCGGNENNFETIQECENNCAPRRAPQACEQEKVTGPCKAYFVRYFYNKDSGKCEEFIYGGCSGNSNNFNTHDECEAVCLS